MCATCVAKLHNTATASTCVRTVKSTMAQYALQMVKRDVGCIMVVKPIGRLRLK
jgi:hypothetical protein